MRPLFPAPPAAAGLPLSLPGEESFEGPLDVLLALLGQDPDRILTVPVARVTAQYLAWLAAAQERGLAQTVDFVETAVFLIRLKLEVLLRECGGNGPDGSPGTAAADPREELARRLRARQAELAALRQQVQEVAQMLRNDRLVGAAFLPRGADLATEEPTHREASDLLVRIRAARRQYDQPRPLYAVAADALRDADLRAWLRAQLTVSGDREFGSLLAARPARAEPCALFCALLHGCQARDWSLEQTETFGAIQVSSRKPAEATRSNPAAHPVMPPGPA